MKKFKKKYNVILCIGILILVCIILLFYHAGYFPIMGRMIAENKLTKYENRLVETHQKIDARYDWYNTRYLAIREDAPTLCYRLQTNTIYDETVSTQINLGAKAQFHTIKEIISPSLTFESNIYIWTTMNADDYSVKSQRMYLLGIYNSQDILEEESQKMPAAIARQVIYLMGDEYNFTGVQLIYYDRNGGYTIEIPSDTFEPLTYDDMLKKTRKMEQKELSEQYFHWLELQ